MFLRRSLNLTTNVEAATQSVLLNGRSTVKRVSERVNPIAAIVGIRLYGGTCFTPLEAEFMLPIAWAP